MNRRLGHRMTPKNRSGERLPPEMSYCEISKEMSSLILGLQNAAYLRLEFENLTVDCTVFTAH
jgi:hypothetical protein